LLFTLYIIAAIVCAVIAVVAFFQYVRFRMADKPELEKKWMAVHFITLALFVLFGVLILVHLTNTLNGRHQL
jgi:hypothetical protein